MLDVKFYEAFEEEAARLRALLPTRVRSAFTGKTIQEEGDRELPARLISLRTQSLIPAEWVATRAPAVAGILSRTTGYDHVLRQRDALGFDLPCGYLPIYCSRAVAEQALTLWMALLRRLPRQIENFPRFDRNGLTGAECAGKTLVVVGVGNIGSEIAHIGQGLGMRVIGVDLVHKHSFVDYAPIEEALPQADIVVSAMNLTKSNRGYFSEECLLRAPRGAIFVNVARGELSPAGGLLALLERGHLAAVGLDVFDHESEVAVAMRTGRASDDPETAAVLALASRPDTILTPHNAFNTAEAVERKASQSVEQVESFLKTQEFVWPVPDE
ncbi:MAG: hydroxyacid dehydrogenase [Candidatus Eisenbacteria bacterium]|nr:hydroxyacid dehydrogenase [Candidatus Eisenbacteria bacterium]